MTWLFDEVWPLKCHNTTADWLMRRGDGLSALARDVGCKLVDVRPVILLPAPISVQGNLGGLMFDVGSVTAGGERPPKWGQPPRRDQDLSVGTNSLRKVCRPPCRPCRPLRNTSDGAILLFPEVL